MSSSSFGFRNRTTPPATRTNSARSAKRRENDQPICADSAKPFCLCRNGDQPLGIDREQGTRDDMTLPRIQGLAATKVNRPEGFADDQDEPLGATEVGATRAQAAANDESAPFTRFRGVGWVLGVRAQGDRHRQAAARHDQPSLHSSLVGGRSLRSSEAAPKGAGVGGLCDRPDHDGAALETPPVARPVEPFHAGATSNFRWSPLDSARSYTCEEDLLTELFGRRAGRSTQPRQMRVDIVLGATLPYGSTTSRKVSA
jgi:hypothetical protein